MSKIHANYIRSRSEMIDIARDEIKRQKAEICPKCSEGIQQRVLATVFWILHRDYGHTAKWIEKLKAKVESEFDLMTDLPDIEGVAYNASTLIDELKAIGVDLAESSLKQGDA